MNSETLTDIKNLIVGISRGNGKDAIIPKKNFAKSVVGYAFLTYIFLHYATLFFLKRVCRRDLGPSPLILGDIWYI